DRDLAAKRPEAEKLKLERARRRDQVTQAEEALATLRVILAVLLILTTIPLVVFPFSRSPAWLVGALILSGIVCFWGLPTFLSKTDALIEDSRAEQEVARKLDNALAEIANSEKRLGECKAELQQLAARFAQRQQDIALAKKREDAHEEAAQQEQQ